MRDDHWEDLRAILEDRPGDARAPEACRYVDVDTQLRNSLLRLRAQRAGVPYADLLRPQSGHDVRVGATAARAMAADRPIEREMILDRHRWALLDEWDRVRVREPSVLTVYAPAAERAETDEAAVAAAIRASLTSASGPLRRVDPLSRQEKISLRLGLLFWFLSILVSTAIDRASEDVVAEGISQGIVVVGWVALWPPAARFMTEVVPHFFNRKRF